MTEGWPSSIGSFDDIFQRFFGSGMLSQPPVRRTDLGRLMTDDAELLIATARETARDWGNHEIVPEHLLFAATEAEPGRGSIAELGHDPDKVADQMRDAGEPVEDADEPVTLGPAAVRALRAAQRRAAEAGGLDPVVGRAEEIGLSRLLDGKLGPGDAVRVDAGDSGSILGAIEHRGGQTVESGV
ncbi:Clp protease N-terminal domain-containing protein [Nocardia xishanensis]|uniref:Clp protease N-terminal domain-containing protein n=1 Tax=Nocardia xishanensis TaxID=238964 RepID=UPI0033EED5DC